MEEIDENISRLFDSGVIIPIKGYGSGTDILIRFIEASQIGVLEILIAHEANEWHLQKSMFINGELAECSKRAISLTEKELLNSNRKKLILFKYDMALRASPPAVDSGNYLIEIYDKNAIMTYYRSGFSSSNPADINYFRNVVLDIASKRVVERPPQELDSE